MKFDIYGRFRVDVQRKDGAWLVYRSDQGKRRVMDDVVVPSDLTVDELATYLDDIFHEYGSIGQHVVLIAD